MSISENALTGPNDGSINQDIEHPKHNEKLDHLRVWNMPAGWVAPGIVHPDDVSTYRDAEKDYELARKAGGVVPRTTGEQLEALKVTADKATENIVRAIRARREWSLVGAEIQLANDGKGWRIVFTRNDAPSEVFESETAATDRAREVLRKVGGSTIRVHFVDGRYQDQPV